MMCVLDVVIGCLCWFLCLGWVVFIFVVFNWGYVVVEGVLCGV